jgi:hypothetical protein
MKDKILPLAMAAAAVASGASHADALMTAGTYTVECRDAAGNVKWVDTIHNLVTTVGKNDLLDKYLAGSAYTAAFFVGLISSTTYTTGPAATDTMASHGGWVEAGGATAPLYSQAARPTAVWSAAAAGAKALSAALTFSIVTTGGTVKGCFLTTISTKDGTTGILFSAGTFTGGDKIVAPGDTLSVSYSLTV